MIVIKMITNGDSDRHDHNDARCDSSHSNQSVYNGDQELISSNNTVVFL